MANGIRATAFLSDSSQDSARSDARSRDAAELSAHAADGGGGAKIRLEALAASNSEDKAPLAFLQPSQAGSETPRLGGSPTWQPGDCPAGFPDMETAEQDEAEAAAGPLSPLRGEKEKPILASPKVSPPSQSRDSFGDDPALDQAAAAEVFFIGTPPVLPPDSIPSTCRSSRKDPLDLPRGNLLPAVKDWASSPRDALHGSPRDLRGALATASEEVRSGYPLSRSSPLRPRPVPWNPAGSASHRQPLGRTASHSAVRAEVSRVGSKDGALTTPRGANEAARRSVSRSGGAIHAKGHGTMPVGSFPGGNAKHGSLSRSASGTRPRSVDRRVDAKPAGASAKAAPVRQSSGVVLASSVALSRWGHASSLSRTAHTPVQSSDKRPCDRAESPLRGTSAVVSPLEGAQGLLAVLERLAPASPHTPPLAVAAAGRPPPSARRGPDFKPKDWVSNLRSSGSNSTLSPRPVSTGRMPSPRQIRQAWSPAGTSPPKWMPMSGAPPPSARVKAEVFRSDSPPGRALPVAQVQESPRFAVPPPPETLLAGPSSKDANRLRTGTDSRPKKR